jgi:3-oxoacyl-[acyl-carrier protein] reductase
MFESLKQKNVLITGASGGIGAATARLFASYGARIGLHYRRNRDAAEALRAELTQGGAEVELFQGDFLEPGSCTALMKACLERFGMIHVLINNAGAVVGPCDLAELNGRSWDDTFVINAKAPFFLAQQAFLHMKQRGGGRIINISSVGVKYGGSAQTLHYAAAKAALETITTGMAKAGARYGILVNCIRAGFIDTPIHQKVGRVDIEERVRMIPLGRAGQPIDVAQAALFLASDASGFITGEVLTVAGGD